LPDRVRKWHASAPERSNPQEGKKLTDSLLGSVLLKGLSVPRSARLDEFANRTQATGDTLVGAHLVSRDDHYRQELIGHFQRHPSAKLAAYLSQTSGNKEERLSFASEAARLDDGNAFAHLLHASALFQTGATEQGRVALAQARRLDVCDAYSSWFTAASDEAFRFMGVDETSISIAREQNPWEQKLGDTLNLVVARTLDETEDNIVATVRLVHELQGKADPRNWRLGTVYLDGAELALLSKLRPDSDYDGSQTVEERIQRLSWSRRTSLTETSKAGSILQRSPLELVKAYYVVSEKSGDREAAKWLLGQ
jgi:hypothetical protein